MAINNDRVIPNEGKISLDPVALSLHKIWTARAIDAFNRARARLLKDEHSRLLELEYRYRRYLAEFGESNSDIYISTFSKSGTTWMQLILYQLTTGGEMDFDHLFDVSPWVWYSSIRQVAPAQTPLPRLLKSHDDYLRFKKGRRGRFIFVTRDGRDVCVSLYHHRRNFKGFKGSFNEHFEEFLNGTQYNWFEHTRRWMENESGLPIIYIRFEDLKQCFEKTVRGLAQSLSLPVSDEIIQRTIEHCSFRSMKKHELQLGPRNSHFSGIEGVPYHVKNPDQFIRRGEVGEGLMVLSDDQLTAYGERFDQSLKHFELLKEYR